MAPDRATPRGPAAARGPCPRGSQGAERRFRVPPSGMKAAASASRRSRAAEREGWAAPGVRPPCRLPRRTAAGRAGSGSGAEEVRSLLSRRWVHAAAFLRGGAGGKIRVPSFNTKKDAAGVISLCPGGFCRLPSRSPPPPAPATLVPFPSLRTCHQLSSLRAAPSSAPSPTPPGCRALLAGQPWGQEEDPRPDEERGKTRERQGAQGQRADDRDEAAPLLTRLPGAAFARRGLETMGLQTSQAESSARAKFLEAKKSTDFGFAT